MLSCLKAQQLCCSDPIDIKGRAALSRACKNVLMQVSSLSKTTGANAHCPIQLLHVAVIYLFMLSQRAQAHAPVVQQARQVISLI